MTRPTALLLVCLAMAAPAWAQLAPAGVRALMRADGSTVVLHTLPVPPGGGARLVRDGAPVPDSARAAADEAAFLTAVAGYEDRLALALETDDRGALYLGVQARPVAGRLLTFLYAPVADALGRRFVDADATPGRHTYRVETFDAAGQPTGDAAEGTVTLAPRTPATPVGAEATSDAPGRLVVSWTYPTNARATDDGVVQFRVHRLGGGAARELTERAVALRFDNRTDYAFVVDGVAPGETVRLAVTAVDAAGQASAPAEVTVVVPDVEPPPQVQNVAVRAEGPAVELTWPVSPAPDAAGYHVERAGAVGGPYARLTAAPLPVLETVFRDTAPAARRPFFYRVVAVDRSGNEAPPSAAAMALVEDRERPAGVADLRAEPAPDGSVALTWRQPMPVPDLRTYVVLRRAAGTREADQQLHTVDVRETRFRDTGALGGGLLPGAFYRYAVVAADSARNVSDTVSVVVQIPDREPPPAPPAVEAVAEAGGARVLVRWGAPGVPDVGGYRVLRDGTEIARVGTAERSLRDADVAVGQTLRYTVVAVDTLGNASAPSAPAVVTMRDATPPPPVAGLRTARDGTASVLTWAPLAEADLAGYRVLASDLPTGVFAPVGPETAEPSSRVAPGRWYRVVAVDTSGNESRPSEPVRAD